MKLLQIIIAVYLTGFICFSVSGITGTRGWGIWDYVYYLWVDGAGVGFVTWLLLYNLVPSFKKVLKPLVWFSGAVLLWDIISFVFKIGINNPTAVSICFLIVTAIVVFLIFIEWPKSK